MPVFESPELVGLFRTYTASPDSVAAHFNTASAGTGADDPLIVASGTDIALYPGHGQAPIVEGIRTATRGFKELAGVSHLGPAVASIMHMAEVDPDGHWRADADRLITACRVARRANSIELWREQIAVAAYRGREEQIARLVDYSCHVTERYLRSALEDPENFTPDTLRSDYLEGPSNLPLPVPFNRIMIATFFLAGMDIAHRIISWFDALDLPWEQTMVMTVGQTGKPTGAVTRETHSIAGIIDAASRGRLPETSLLIAPHAVVFPPADGTNLAEIAGFESRYRELWSGLTAAAGLGPKMFAGYPEFHPRPHGGAAVQPGLKSVSDMPKITSPDDWFALTTRMRVVLEDPRQLLSSAVTDYAGEQLITHGNDPTAVTVPGLDGEPYPVLG
jgi:hypothetical protein